MANKAFQKVYTQLESITKATVSLRAKGVSNDELATVEGRLAQVVKTKGDLVTLQIFAGTEGIPTDAEVAFLGEPALAEAKAGTPLQFERNAYFMADSKLSEDGNPVFNRTVALKDSYGK